MGWDGSGNFNRTNGVFTGIDLWQQSRDAARRIRADDQDTHDQDIADGLENTITRDGQNQPSTNLPMANFRHTSVGNAVNRNEYATAGQVQDNDVTFVPAASVGGTADAITLTPSPAISAYAAGQRFQFVVEANNTGAVTLNVSGLGTRALTKIGTGALEADDITTNALADVYYDGTQFQLLNLIGTDAAIQTTLGLVPGTDIAGLGNANTFTTNQTIDRSGSAAVLGIGTDLDTGNNVAGIDLFAHDSVGGDTNYGAIRADVIDNTNTLEDGRVRLRARVQGADTDIIIYGPGVQIGSPTGGDQGADTINVSEYYEDGVRLKNWTAASVSASGAAVDIDLSTEVANGARDIEIRGIGISQSGAADFLGCQIGASSIETSGYVGGVSTGSTDNSFSDQFLLIRSGVWATTDVLSFVARLHNPSGNIWVIDGQTFDTSSADGSKFTGHKTLSGALETLRLRIDGTKTFDAGTFYYRSR